MARLVWVPLEAVLAIHRELIAEHGGLSGPPNMGNLEAALARPRNLIAYAGRGAKPSLSRLAAAYGYGLSRGHFFPEGNKRISLAVVDVFLQLNGAELTASEPDAVVTFLALASGELSEAQLAEWIEASSA